MSNNEINKEDILSGEISNKDENIEIEEFENSNEENINKENNEIKQNYNNFINSQRKKDIKIRIVIIMIIALFINFISFPAGLIELIYRIVYDYDLKIELFVENAIYTILLLFLFIQIIFHKIIIYQYSLCINCISFFLILGLIIINIYDIYNYFDNTHNEKKNFIDYVIQYKIISAIFIFCFDICFIIFIIILIKVSKTINLSHIKIV